MALRPERESRGGSEIIGRKCMALPRAELDEISRAEDFRACRAEGRWKRGANRTLSAETISAERSRGDLLYAPTKQINGLANRGTSPRSPFTRERFDHEARWKNSRPVSSSIAMPTSLSSLGNSFITVSRRDALAPRTTTPVATKRSEKHRYTQVYTRVCRSSDSHKTTNAIVRA